MTTELTSEQIGEIRTAYRDAADPKKQIGILADLYCTTRQEICRVLEIEAPPKKKARSYDQAVKKDVVKAVLLEGMSYKDAAEKFGVPYGNVSAWVQATRKKQTEFGVEAIPVKLDQMAKSQVPAEMEEGSADRILRDLLKGIDGLHRFIDGFDEADILSEDERDILERILCTASGYADGLKRGLKMARMEVKTDASNP